MIEPDSGNLGPFGLCGRGNSSVMTTATPDDGVPTTPTTDAPGDARDDVDSDPGKGDAAQADWTDEGGATNEGPSTDTDSA